MNRNNPLLTADFSELVLHECGREKCQPGKIIKNDVKNYHLFHYILYGHGTFVFQGQTYQLKKGDLFYIPPGEQAIYYPSKQNPWIYTWIGFAGNRTSAFLSRVGLDANHPIYQDGKDLPLKPLFNELADTYNHAKYLNLECLAVFLNIVYKMMILNHESDVMLTPQQSHIRMAKQFIENNFQFPIKIYDIADSLSLSPNYLANIFKQELGLSPKQYLIEYRIQKACQYLSSSDSLIKDIAKRVGYKNPLHFSNEFKRIKQVSPTEYKKHNQLLEDLT
jgi:AraC-like DNA-binding protein